MLWVLASVVLLALAVWPKLLWIIGDALGLFYLTVAVIIAFGFLALMVLHLGMAASRAAEDRRRMAQRLAFLTEELERLSRAQEGEKAEGREGAPPGVQDQARGEQV